MDDYYSIYGCIIACSRVLYHLHVTDDVRLDVLQFVKVGQLSAVQIDEGRSLAENLITVTFLRDGGNAREHILGGAYAFHYCSLNVHYERVAVQLHLRALALHHHAVDGVVVWTQADGSDVLFVAQPEDGLVADVRDAGKNCWLLYRYCEVAARVGHAAAE